MAITNEEILIKLKALDELTPVMLKALSSMEAATAKMSASLDQVAASTNQTKEKTEEFHSGVINLAAGFSLVKQAAEVAYAAFEKVEQFLAHAIEESLEAEKAFNRLQGALISTGQYTTELAQEMDEYAESVQKATGASAESTKNFMAQGIQMGLSVEQAKELEEATRKLAAATGESLESAFGLMQSSLAGQSRGLGKVLPQVKDLSAAQLKHGDAIAIVNSALDAQYKLYEGSFAAGVAKAKAGVADIYKEIGNLITQNPMIISAMSGFTKILFGIAETIKEANHWIKDHQVQITEAASAIKNAVLIIGSLVAIIMTMNTVIPIAAAVWGALTTSVSLYGVAGTIAANATALLNAGLAILLSPVTLVIGAVVLLTAAFYKWPGLFDILIGGIKALLGIALFPLTAALGGLALGIGAIVGVFKKDWGEALTSAGTKMIEMNANLVKAGAAQISLGVESIKAGNSAKEGAEAAADANEKAKESASKHAAEVAKLQKLYDGFAIGTQKQRESLAAQVSDRDQDLKFFTEYLEAKKRLAISKAQEQEMEVNKVRAEALKGGAGGETKSAESQVAIDAEIKKQAELKALRDKGILDLEAYNQAVLDSEQRKQTAELEQAVAHQQALASALGTSEEAYQLQQQINEERFQLEMQMKLDRAMQEDATQQQIMDGRAAMQAQYNMQREADQQAHYQRLAAYESSSGMAITATRDLYFLKQKQAQDKSIKDFASGVQMMESIQAGMNAGFQKLGSALIKNQKITASTVAGVALEAIGTQVQQQGFANLVLGLFPPNPAAIAAGTAQVALGTGIGRLGVAMQQGQAHEGMDEIPQNLDNKTWILAGGERIVQPEANRKLTAFLDNQEAAQNQGTSGTNYNIVINYTGTGAESDIREMADKLVQELRIRSDRGEPIISDKGVVNS